MLEKMKNSRTSNEPLMKESKKSEPDIKKQGQILIENNEILLRKFEKVD